MDCQLAGGGGLYVKLQIEPDILPSSSWMMAKEVQMTKDQREIHRKKRVLEYAERIGNINKACRYFEVARSSFYEWRDRYRELGDEGLSSMNGETDIASSATRA
jgi:hypothetical protein